MFVSKRNIYNQSVESIATNALIESDSLDINSDDQDVFLQFIHAAVSEVDGGNNCPFHVIIPYQYHGWLESINDDMRRSISLKINAKEFSPHHLDTKYALVGEVSSAAELAKIKDNADSVIIDEQLVEAFEKDLPFLVDKCDLIVSNINKYESFNRLKSMGINYFEGYFIEKPQLINQCQIPTNKMSVLNLISALNSAHAEIEDLSKIIVADSVLSYKLLRIVNSPMFRGINEVTSIQQAIVRFGFANLKKWVLMLSLCDISEKPKALIKIALQRGLMCQRLAEIKGHGDSLDNYYTAGLLSTLDALIDHSMENLLKDTALCESIKEAILVHKGPIGEALKKVILYQRGERAVNGIDMTRLYIECANEVNDIFHTLNY